MGVPVHLVALAKLAAVIWAVEYRRSNWDAVPLRLSSPGVVHDSCTLFDVTWASTVACVVVSPTRSRSGTSKK